MPMRLCQNRPLPPYSYVPGKFPHPLRNPAGHSFGRTAEVIEPPDETTWPSCEPYLFGIDLFHHGYYWEAHEEWEGVWHACGRRGTFADFLKGLIKLAAAGVKAREGSATGVRRHLLRAAELFEKVEAKMPTQRLLGLRPLALALCARDLVQKSEKLVNTGDQPVVVVMPIELDPVRHQPSGQTL